MGWFSEDVEVVDRSDITNSVYIANKDELRIESNEIFATLLVIMVLLFVMVVLRIVAIIKKSARRETQRDQMILREPARRQV